MLKIREFRSVLSNCNKLNRGMEIWNETLTTDVKNIMLSTTKMKTSTTAFNDEHTSSTTYQPAK